MSPEYFVKGARFPGRPRPLMSTPRGHIRPDKRGVSDPRLNGVMGRLPGVAEGAQAPGSLLTVIRAASAAAKNAAALSTTARAQLLVFQRVAIECRTRDGSKGIGDPLPNLRLEGGQLRSDALSPFLSPHALCEAAIN
jgi:hypothetical protein